MREKLRFIGLGLIAALAAPGCAQISHLLAAPDSKMQLEARGPGMVFPSIEAAAIDALIYTYLRADDERDTERMRAGTIYSVETGYSYGEIHVASSVSFLKHQIDYPLKQRDVARFHMYPFVTDRDVNRGNERASRADRRSVAVTDPLHRSLFILHPSLVIREYRAINYETVTVEVADLRHPKEGTLFAGQ